MNSMYKQMALIAAMAMGGYEWYGSPRVNENARRFALSNKYGQQKERCRGLNVGFVDYQSVMRIA